MGRGGRGGGGGGGGHSFGGGGGRSFGGGSGGRSRGGGSINRGGGSHSFGSGGPSFRIGPNRGSFRYGGLHVDVPIRPPRPPRPPRRTTVVSPVIINTGSESKSIVREVHENGTPISSGMGGPETSRYDSNTSTNSGVMIILVIAGLLLALFALFLAFTNPDKRNYIEREKITPLVAFDRDTIIDELGWITNEREVLEGMEEFYDKTGVQPILVITDNIYGSSNPSIDDIEARCNEIYDQVMGTNEGGLLFMFCEWSSSNYDPFYLAGTSAQSVMDSDATDTLINFANSLYTTNLSDEQYFSRVFSDTADRIMSKPKSNTPAIIVVVLLIGVDIIVIGVYSSYKKKLQREREKAAETERILNSRLEDL